MKRLIISLAIFTLVFGTSFLGIRFVNKTYTELEELLTSAETAAEREDFAGAGKLCKRVEDIYTEREKLLSAFVNRGDLNEIGVSISTVAPLAGKDSKAEFLSALKGAKTSLTHLKNDQSPSSFMLF